MIEKKMSQEDLADVYGGEERLRQRDERDAKILSGEIKEPVPNREPSKKD